MTQATDDTMGIDEHEAKLISRALSFVNGKMAAELEKILHSQESDYLKEAATTRYNEDVEGFSKLHVRLAQHFPGLTQR